MSVGNAVRRALYGKMTGDTTLTGQLGTSAPSSTARRAIYSDVGPGDIPDNGYPYIVFFQTSSVPIGMIAAGAEVENDLWTIKAVDRHPRPTGASPGADAAETIQARLDTLLTDGTISISGGTQLYLRRESDVNYSEQSNGSVYFHRGCVFRLIWQ